MSDAVIDVRLPRARADALLELAPALGFEGAWMDEHVISERTRDGYSLAVRRDVDVVVSLCVAGDVDQARALVPALRRRIAHLAPARIAARAIDEDPHAWRAAHRTIDIDRRIALVPHWLPRPRSRHARVIRTDPGGAFGTGEHGTTRDCLRALIEHVDRDTVMVDLGSGSGVLSIAALALGARRVTALDIDPQAGRELAWLAQLNALRAPRFVCADWREARLGHATLVVSNIGATESRSLVPRIAALPRRPIVVLSGIAAWSRSGVDRALARAHLEVLSERSDDPEWVTLVVQRGAEKEPRRAR